MTNDRLNGTPRIRTAHTPLYAGMLTLLALTIGLVFTSTAMAEESASATARPAFGQNTRAWLDEQRNDVNRAEPEPYPASRAAAAVQRYESTVGTDSGSSATRAGTSIGIRSGTPAAGNTPTPGMGR